MAMWTPPSETHTVYSDGIYHGLPVLPDSAKDLTAIVTGGSGISGQSLIRLFLSRPARWSRIISLSRKPPPPNTPAASEKVQHIPIDLLGGPDTIAKSLKDAGVDSVDYVFHTAYKETSNNGLWSGQKEMWDENGKMLEDFLVALEKVTGGEKGKKVKRVVLQTGCKHYGVHLGRVAGEVREEDGRCEGKEYEKELNFYYRQEDILAEYSPKHGFDYTVVRPNNIIGTAAGNFMNEAISIGLYISVSKELGGPVLFPGTFEKWFSVEAHSSSTLNAYIEEWAALSPQCSNEGLNAVNGDSPTWSRLWPALLKYYNIPVPSSVTDIYNEQFYNAKIPEEWKGTKAESPKPAPFDRKTHSVTETRISMEKWAKDPKVVKAWEKVRDRYGLEQKVWDGASWSFADGVLGMTYNLLVGTQKLRRLGFFGQVDTIESWIEVFKDAAETGLLPKP